METWDCHNCGAPDAITRERQELCIPGPGVLTTRVEHDALPGAPWCSVTRKEG